MKRLIIVTLLFTCNALFAAPVIYTDKGAFMSALVGSADVLDFDSILPGTPLVSGLNVNGVTFNYDFGGVKMEVRDDWATTSGSNYLGTTDLGIFQDGDDFNMGLESVNAIGLSLISGDPLYDDDFILAAAGTSVGLDASAIQQTLSDGSNVFFLGIIDNANAFTAADITTIGGGYFLYNVDDVVTSVVPLPPAIWLFLSGLGLLGRFKR